MSEVTVRARHEAQPTTQVDSSVVKTAEQDCYFICPDGQAANTLYVTNGPITIQVKATEVLNRFVVNDLVRQVVPSADMSEDTSIFVWAPAETGRFLSHEEAAKIVEHLANHYDYAGEVFGHELCDGVRALVINNIQQGARRVSVHCFYKDASAEVFKCYPEEV